MQLIPLTGHETKALLNNSGPRYKRSKLERQMNVDVLWCVLILIVMCLFSAVGKFPYFLLLKGEILKIKKQNTNNYMLLQANLEWQSLCSVLLKKIHGK